MHLEQRHTRSREIFRIILAGSAVNILLVAFKFFAGYAGRSSAMVADAVHSLSDLVTDIIVLVFVRISSRPKDRKHEFGHGKFETMATALIGIILIGIGFGIFLEGGRNILGALRGESIPEPGMIALWAALISIISKEAIFRATKIIGKRVNSQVVIANAWHHRSDSLSSLGTAAGISGAIFLGDKWRVLDPIAAVAVSVFIIKVALELTLPAINDLLERSLPEKTEKEILEAIGSVEGANDPHNLRTRRIGNDYAIEIHIRADDNMPVRQAHGIASEIETRLRERFGMNTHIIVHVEPAGR